MNGATLQAKIYASYASAAQRIGVNADQYRATGANNPTAPGNKLRTMLASFNPEDMAYKRSDKYSQPAWYGLFDGRLTQQGDYLICNTGTYFIATQKTHLPILCVLCTHTVDIRRPQIQTGVGALSYGGDTDSNETLLMQQWPCSILHKGGGEKGPLPGDVGSAAWEVLLPAFTGVTLRFGDILTDNTSRRFVISSAELTSLGWRLSTQQAET